MKWTTRIVVKLSYVMVTKSEKRPMRSRAPTPRVSCRTRACQRGAWSANDEVMQMEEWDAHLEQDDGEVKHVQRRQHSGGIHQRMR